MKEFLANIPLYTGMGINSIAALVGKLGNTFLSISFRLHVKLGTETGKKIQAIENLIKEKFEELTSAVNAAENGVVQNPLEAALKSKPKATKDKVFDNMFRIDGKNKPTREN